MLLFQTRNLVQYNITSMKTALGKKNKWKRIN